MRTKIIDISTKQPPAKVWLHRRYTKGEQFIPAFSVKLMGDTTKDLRNLIDNNKRLLEMFGNYGIGLA